jgi:type I restriction enzyme, R subunit
VVLPKVFVDEAGCKPLKVTEPRKSNTCISIIAELNERFGLNLGPEHKVTLGQMMQRLDEDAALDAAARARTRD